MVIYKLYVIFCVKGSEYIIIRIDYLNKYFFIFQIILYNFLFIEIIGEMCVGVVKVLVLYLKNVVQYFLDF